MSQVGHTGSTQQAQVDYSSKIAALSGSNVLDEVGAGDLAGQNIRFSREEARNEVLKGQQLRVPDLDTPDDVKPTHMESANSDVGDLRKLTEKALDNTSELIKNARNGTLTPEQQSTLEKHSETLRGAAEYLNGIGGKNVSTGEGKKAVLAGLGFNQSQLDALMSLANPDDEGNTLASLHGGSAALQGKKDALKAQGFSEGQIEALLALAGPDDEGNFLASTYQAGSGPKSALRNLGFSEAQTERLLALLNGRTTGTEDQKNLLKQMGYTDAEADVILAFADPKILKQQEVLGTEGGDAQVEALMQAANAANVLSTGSSIGDGVLKQLADIFVVLELLHQMSVQGRRTARESRSLEYDAAKAEVLKQAGEMRKAAINTLVAGVVTSSAKIAAGAISMAGATGGKSKAPKGADANTKAQAEAAATQASLQKASAVSQMVSASGEVAGAGFNYQAQEHQARQKEHEAFQKTHDNAAQSDSEWMQLQQDMVKTVQSKMDEIIRTWFETLKTTTRG